MNQKTGDNLIVLTKDLFGLQYDILDVALETNIFSSNNQNFTVIDFLGRKVIWINPIKEGDHYLAQRVRLACLQPDGFDDYGVVSKFLSVLSYISQGQVVYELFNSQGPFPGPSCVRKSLFNHFREVDILYEFINLNLNKLTDLHWSQLAFYRQGINARSPYLSFLSFWKIIESSFQYDSEKIKYFINSEIASLDYNQAWGKLSDKDAYVRLYTSRTAAAHYAVGNGKKQRIQNPDNPYEYIPMIKDADIIKRLAEKLLLSFMQ